MKIVRDGKEYELTRAELVQAFEELREMNFKEEIKYELKDCADEFPKFAKWCERNADKLEDLADDALCECQRIQYEMDNEPVDDFVQSAIWSAMEDFFCVFDEGEDGYEVYEEMF